MKTNLNLLIAGILLATMGTGVGRPAITLQPTNFPSVSLGATTGNRVVATGTLLSYQWRLNSVPLPGRTQSSIILTNIQLADGGDYDVVVTNTSGSVTSSTTTLNVDPTFTKITTGVVVSDEEGSVTGNWADYDNDGYVDLYVANSIGSGSTRNTLYHNEGGTNFSRVNASPFTTDFMRTWTAAWADYDNDGNVDLVTANIDGGVLAQRLYSNNGNGTFTAVIDAALRSDSSAATCPWWFDYDNDGFVDLFVTKGRPWGGSAANDCLFRNNGDGTFRKMSAAEVAGLVSDQMGTEICLSVDYDNDGRQELSVFHTKSVGNSWFYTNIIWQPQDNGPFVTRSLGIPSSALPSIWADYDNDGWADVFCHTADLDNRYPILFHNQGSGGFADATAAFQVTTNVSPVGATWGDYDNDGWLDIFCVGAHWISVGIPNGLFHNNRNGTFTQVLTGSPVWDADRRIFCNWADYNNDGFLDLFIAVGDGVPQRNRLYRNNGNTNHWLKVKLDGRASNRSGIGAKVRLQATINGQTFWQMREISCASGYAGQNGLLAHFGLGDATNVATLRIEWPSGIVQELQNVAANQFLTVVEHQDTGSAPAFAGTAIVTDGIQLSITEPAAETRYILEASTNLVSWTKLLARTSAGGTTQFTDARATNYTRRFYRLQVP
ncbi:MAG TPA: CRTAC1 family protein [Verrucomicrobiae bacterium]